MTSAIQMSTNVTLDRSRLAMPSGPHTSVERHVSYVVLPFSQEMQWWYSVRDGRCYAARAMGIYDAAR
jgi:hypothetical protein